jgi:tetratricopeptide (TPR) repeat protein
MASSSRFTLAALALAILLLPAAPARAEQTSEMGASLSGNYLAGRYAGAQRDNRTAAGFYARALDDDPDNAMILDRAFMLEVSAGNIERAVALAGRVLERDKRHRVARLVLGLKAFRAGRYKTARSHFKAASQGPIGELTSAILTAWSFQAERKTREAVAALDDLQKTEAFAVFRAYNGALIHDLAGNRTKAEPLYRTAYERASGSFRIVQSFGSFLERAGRFEEAAKLYADMLDGAPDRPMIDDALARNKAGTASPRPVQTAVAGAAEGLFSIASALTDESSIDGALMYVQVALYMDPDLTIAQTLLGNIYKDTDRRVEAIEAYEKVPANSPLRPNADLQIAINLEKLDRVDEAKDRLAGIIARYPDDRRPVIAMADLLRIRKDYAGAIGFYDKAVDLGGDATQRDWTLYYYRGICHERTKQWPSAEADFKKALELNPDQPLVLNYLGYSWVEQNMNLAEAMDMIRKAVELRANDGYIVDSLGWAHFKLREYAEAVKILERAVELRPDDPVINDHLGDAYWRVGRTLEARFQWSHAKDLEPEPDDLEEIVRKLEQGLPPEEAGKATSQTGTPGKS